MRQNKRSKNKTELLKETKNAGAYLNEQESMRKMYAKIEVNRRSAFENFTRNERENLEKLHRLRRVKAFSEYLLKMPKFFDEPDFYLDYLRAKREINTTIYARLILIGFLFWLYVSFLVSGGGLLALMVYVAFFPLIVLLLFRGDY